MLYQSKGADDVERISALERCAILESQEMLDEINITEPSVNLDQLLDDVSAASAGRT